MKTVNQLATEIVGDGKSPNKYFITIGYGWYKPVGSEELVQKPNSLESVTILCHDKDNAYEIFNAIEVDTEGVSGQKIGQVILEDRKTGVLAEKYCEERYANYFVVDSF